MKSGLSFIWITLVLSVVLNGCGGGGATATPQTRPVNSAPSISGLPQIVVAVGDNYSYAPTASDPDGDALTFTVENQPGWAAFSTVTGALTGRPQSGDEGTHDNIMITASDGQASASTARFSITVTGAANSSPTISGTPMAQVNVGQGYSFVPTATDADGDSLTFSVQNPPVWANFDAVTGTLSGTPGQGDAGTYPDITISVSDGTNTAALPVFAITVNQVALGQATLSWTVPTNNEDGSALNDLAGYRFYYGASPGNYTNEIQVDNAGISSYVIGNLTPGTYYFAAKTINSSGQTSAFSNEAMKQVAGQ